MRGIFLLFMYLIVLALAGLALFSPSILFDEPVVLAPFMLKGLVGIVGMFSFFAAIFMLQPAAHPRARYRQQLILAVWPRILLLAALAYGALHFSGLDAVGWQQLALLCAGAYAVMFLGQQLFNWHAADALIDQTGLPEDLSQSAAVPGGKGKSARKSTPTAHIPQTTKSHVAVSSKQEKPPARKQEPTLE